jgi:hypothetical protein
VFERVGPMQKRTKGSRCRPLRRRPRRRCRPARPGVRETECGPDADQTAHEPVRPDCTALRQSVRTGYWLGQTALEPPIGIEPMTYALRACRSARWWSMVRAVQCWNLLRSRRLARASGSRCWEYGGTSGAWDHSLGRARCEDGHRAVGLLRANYGGTCAPRSRRWRRPVRLLAGCGWSCPGRQVGCRASMREDLRLR